MKNEDKQDIECTLFPKAFNTTTYVPTTLGLYIDSVIGGRYKKEVENVRAYVAAGDKEHAAACKKNLPLLVPGGRMEGGRKLEHLVGYSACVVTDLDHVAGSPRELLARAKELAYVKAGHISPSGTGLKLFVLVDSDKAHHLQAFQVVSRRVEADLPGVKVDPSGKDANRGCFVSYDPEAFYKVESVVVNIPVDPGKAASFAEPGAASLSNYIDKYEIGNVFVGGGRHSYVVKLASALNTAGFAAGEVASECLRRYAEPDFGEKEIRGIVTDIYHRYQSSHGSNSRRQATAGEKGKGIKSVKNLTPVSENAHSSEESPMGYDIEPEEGDFPHFDKALLKEVPTLLADIVKMSVDDTEYDLMMLAALTMIGSVLSGVSGIQQNEVYYPPFYTLVIGPSGSGKGCINRVHKVVLAWQHRVFDNSKREVDEYKKKKEAAELYKLQQRGSKGKSSTVNAPEEPELVRQKQLHISGYTTTARMIEQLDANAPYTSLLYETELDSMNNTMAQDFGGYGYILNQSFHHEPVSSGSKTNGSFLVEHPRLGLFATGTPGMLARLVPSTESGLYSRLMIYHIMGNPRYRPLTSDDNVYENAFYFDKLGVRLLEIATFLEKWPTFVSFTDRQRKKLDRYFEREYYNVRVFGNDDVTSVVLRHRLIIFRIAMVLTALRKGEARVTERNRNISDVDFDIAFHIGTTCLRHALMVSTTMKHSETEQHFKGHTAQRDLFAAMPDKFKTAEILAEASVRGISRASVFRMLKKAQDYKLLISLGGGYYQKTESGKNVASSEMG